MGPGGIQFEATINLGNLVTILTGLFVWGITFAVAWTRFGNRLDMMDFRMDLADKVLQKIGTAIERFTENQQKLALLEQSNTALETQFATLHETVEKLRSGDGWIREKLDREY